jgi:DNA-binding NarL/FixJ family response regulator
LTGGSSPVRIIAVDDHPLVRDGNAGLIAIQTDMTLVAQAANGRDAIQQFRMHRPDVTLMDLQIADQLHVTEDTIKGRVKSILAKLDANDRMHAAIIGLKKGIIGLSSV